MKNKESNDRRSFLKKALYKAPVIIAMGALTRPTNVKAFTSPPEGPSGSIGQVGQ